MEAATGRERSSAPKTETEPEGPVSPRRSVLTLLLVFLSPLRIGVFRSYHATFSAIDLACRKSSR
jgi:hypothetical protein